MTGVCPQGCQDPVIVVACGKAEASSSAKDNALWRRLCRVDSFFKRFFELDHEAARAAMNSDDSRALITEVALYQITHEANCRPRRIANPIIPV